MAAYLPKSSTDNERSTVVIKAENGEENVSQIAGSGASCSLHREVGDPCDIDEHMGFIKFGSSTRRFVSSAGLRILK